MPWHRQRVRCSCVRYTAQPDGKLIDDEDDEYSHVTDVNVKRLPAHQALCFFRRRVWFACVVSVLNFTLALTY
jgi:hypothetical protein|uniref:Uncharacterized protein n=1 Tax=Zea mays TaxID=4577 RepID=B4FYE8_MAIZE|nr:unknown [Zea mays]